MATVDTPGVAAAGVAHGTFFFHFPTKEHVLLELEHREIERRLGAVLFKDFLALHFSQTRPVDESKEHRSSRPKTVVKWIPA
jgi:AcrR family transcriptional regulator